MWVSGNDDVVCHLEKKFGAGETRLANALQYDHVKISDNRQEQMKFQNNVQSTKTQPIALQNNMEVSLKKRVAFTLAETLIALVVLGVVAAIVISNIYGNYKKRILVTQLKRAYSIVSTAVDNARAENPTVSFAGKNHYKTGDKLPFNIYVGPYLNIKKDCTGINSDCMPVNNYVGTGPWSNDPAQKTYCFCNRSGAIDTNPCYGTRLILKNDIMIYIFENNKIHIDVNGKKGPNKYNYDLFEFYLDKDKGLVPLSGVNSMGCQSYTQKVLTENKIDY